MNTSCGGAWRMAVSFCWWRGIHQSSAHTSSSGRGVTDCVRQSWQGTFGVPRATQRRLRTATSPLPLLSSTKGRLTARKSAPSRMKHASENDRCCQPLPASAREATTWFTRRPQSGPQSIAMLKPLLDRSPARRSNSSVPPSTKRARSSGFGASRRSAASQASFQRSTTASPSRTARTSLAGTRGCAGLGTTVSVAPSGTWVSRSATVTGRSASGSTSGGGRWVQAASASSAGSVKCFIGNAPCGSSTPPAARAG